MSNLACQTGGVKLKTPAELGLKKTDEIVGFLGRTKLIRHHNGLHELSGGTYQSQAVAFEWCQRFAPEIRFGLGLKATSANRRRR
jgi:hypothetical protein